MVSETCPTNPREEASGLDPETVHDPEVSIVEHPGGVVDVRDRREGFHTAADAREDSRYTAINSDRF